jgi:multidrug resistance efflux pump
VLAALARLSSAIARRDQAAAAVAERSVVAPIAGEVLELPYRVGEYVSLMGQTVDPVVVLGDTRTLRARIDVDERDVGRLSVGARAWVVADAWPDRKFEGRVVEIGRRMGRKNVRSDEPAERVDVKILEVVLTLEDSATLIPGQRVTGYITDRGGNATTAGARRTAAE